MKMCSVDGCTNRAKKGGVCIYCDNFRTAYSRFVNQGSLPEELLSGNGCLR